MTQQSAITIHLPPLPDFSDAILEGVSIGPRRAVTLELTPLVWVGSQGHYGLPITVRLGGIVGLEEVAAFFAKHQLPADIAGLSYATGHVSKPNAQFLELIFERVEAQIVIQCHSVTVTD